MTRTRSGRRAAWGAIAVIAAGALLGTGLAPAAAEEAPPLVQLPGSDAFDGTALDAAKWQRVRPDDAALKVADGALTITALAGDLYGGTNTAKNLVLQDAPGWGRWEASTTIDFAPGSCCQQAGLILYTDDSNYASLAFSGRANGQGRLFFLREVGGTPSVPSPIDKPIAQWPTHFSLKVASDGEQVTAHYSADGVTWTPVGTPVAAGQFTKVGLFAMAGTNGAPAIPARFDRFTLLHDGTPPPAPRQPEASVAPIDWDALGEEPLAGVDAVAAEILRNSNEYALTTWWRNKFGNQPTGYLTFGGTGESQIRPVAAEANALATALVTGTYDAAVTGVSEAEARAKAVRLIGSLAKAHYANTRGGWSGSSSWQGALWASQAAQAAWLLWGDLSAEDQRLVGVMVETEADRFIDYDVPYWTAADGTVLSPGDTKAEENSWNSMLLQVATAMFPDHPRHDAWQVKNVELLLSAHAKPSDVHDATPVNGRPLNEWIDGWNVEEDGRAYNHDLLHPDYMATMVQQLYAGTTATLAGQPTPKAALHDMELLYGNFVDHDYPAPPYVAPGGTIYREGSGAVYYPQGTDWGKSRRLQFVAVDAISAAFGVDRQASRDGRYWLELHGDDALAMQARSTDGRTYLASDDDTYNGREEWVAMHAAWSVLSLWAVQNGEFRVSDAPADALDDTVAPVITASVDGRPAPAGAYRSPADLVLDVTDDSAGVASVEYRTQRGDWTTYSAPVLLRPGIWDVEVRAVDANGNVAEQSLDRIRVIGKAVGLPDGVASDGTVGE
ncbi:OmpL47-type beta-barrel domain-containing protein [Agromyces sp. MMS24-K17]|uniref:beta-xylosidase family glycoside hydrolase n=1 Tax=Agromyces sp. MMS24-K17 TaxID=3372850 RepID=UPI003754AECC